MADGHEKGLFAADFVQIFKGKVCYAVGPVAFEVTAASLIIEHIAVIAVACKFKNVRGTPEILIPPAAFGRNCSYSIIHIGWIGKAVITGQMPFAHISGLVAGLVEVIRKRFHVGRQRLIITEAAKLRGIAPGLKQGTAWPAHRLGRIGVLKDYTLSGKSIQIGRYRQWLPIAAAGIGTLLIGKVKYNIGSHLSFLSSKKARIFSSVEA